MLKTLPQLPVPGGGGMALILKGEVLREATTLLVRLMSGMPEPAKKYLPLIERALAEASNFVASHPGNFGSKEWLALVRALTTRILEGKYDAERARPIETVSFLPSMDRAAALVAGGVQ